MAHGEIPVAQLILRGLAYLEQARAPPHHRVGIGAVARDAVLAALRGAAVAPLGAHDDQHAGVVDPALDGAGREVDAAPVGVGLLREEGEDEGREGDP